MRRIRCFADVLNAPSSGDDSDLRLSWAQLSRAAGNQTIWWSQTGSNRRPPACKAGALPTELWPRSSGNPSPLTGMVGLGRLELPTSRLSSARSNQLSYKPLTTRDRVSAASHRNALDAAHGACSSAKKEKRRRRRPANGAQRSGDLLAPDVSKTIR